MKLIFTFTLITLFSFTQLHAEIFPLGGDPDPDYISIADGKYRHLLHMSEGVEEVWLTQVISGSDYRIYTGIAEGQLGGCKPHIWVVNGVQVLEFFDYVFEFKALSSKVKVVVDMPCATPKVKFPVQFSVSCLDPLPVEKKKVGGNRGLTAIPGSVESLIKDVLIGGSCFDVTSITGFGCADGKGEFQGGGSSIGFDEGVILACGNVSNANGPNDSGSKGNSCGGGSDPDLFTLANKPIFDATGIEFDFTPTVPNLSFKYVFGSEEYNEYTCAAFNDVFGFFLSGPGLAGGFTGGAINLATVPNQTWYVGINTVNLGVVGSFGSLINCTPPEGTLSNSAYFVDNTGGSEVQYDGYTTVFEAKAQGLQTCKKYHIKLAIGDAGDGIFDSGVFLEKGSFSAGGSALGNAFVPSTGTNVAYEGCNDAFICFQRPQAGDNDQDQNITFTIKPTSTATLGVDYAPFGNSATIPAGEDSVCVPINIIKDALKEGDEKIIIEINNSCSCSKSEVTMIIRDLPPMEVEMGDVTVCADDNFVDLTPKFIEKGVPDYMYIWSTGEEFPTISVQPLNTTKYIVTVTDVCGQKDTADALITVIPSPSAMIVGSVNLCANDPKDKDSLKITFTGQSPWTFVYSIDGFPQAPITTSKNPYTLIVTQPGVYVIDQIYTEALPLECHGEGEGEAYVDAITLDPTFNVEDVSCKGKEDGSAEVADILKDYQPNQQGKSQGYVSSDYTFKWGKNLGFEDYISGVDAGWYKITITDLIDGCKVVDSVQIKAPPGMTLAAQIVKDADCVADNGAVDLSIVGGTAPFTYLWDNGNTNEDPNNLSQGVHSVTVTDWNGCKEYLTLQVKSPLAPIVTPTVLDNVDCYDLNKGKVSLTVTGGTPGYTFLWDTGVPLPEQTKQNPSGLGAGFYTVTITDAAGCKIITNATITADITPPLVEAGNNKEFACGLSSINLDGAGSSLGSDYTYKWTTSSGSILSGVNTLNPQVGGVGLYYLEVTNIKNGCKSLDSISVYPNQNAPTINIATPDVLTCNITQLNLDAMNSSAGSKYQITWTTVGGNIISGGNTLQPLINAAGKYILTILDTTNNCKNVKEITVGEDKTKPVVAIQPAIELNCEVNLVDLDGTGSDINNGTTYLWTTSNGLISPLTDPSFLQIKAEKAGTYTLTVKSGLTGCTESKDIVVTENKILPIAAIAIPNNITCKNPVVMLDGNGSSQGGKYSYSWASIQPNGHFVGAIDKIIAEVDVPGDYSIVVLDNNNKCKTVAQVNVGIDTLKPTVFIQKPEDLTCTKSKISLSGAGSSSGANFSYQWTTNTGLIESGATTISPLINGPGTYTLEVTNKTNGCKNNLSADVISSQAFPVVLIATPDPINCVTNQIVIDGSASEFNQFIVYAWSTTNGNIVSGANTSSPTVISGGQYTMTSTNTSNGCKTEKQVTVIENKVKPIADAGADLEITCGSQQVALDGTNSSQGPDIIYEWTDAFGIPVPGGAGITLFTQKTGTYILKVLNNTNGCFRYDTAKVKAEFLTDATITMDEPVCFNQPGKVNVTNIYGGKPPFKFSIDGGTTFQNSPIFKKVFPGAYKLVIEDNTQCKLEKEFEIPFVNEILIAIDPQVRITLGDKPLLEAQVNMDPADIKHVQWTPSYGLECDTCLKTYSEPLLTTDYLITVENQLGCKGTTKTRVIVSDPNIFIPNVFSPYKQDGFNDFFTIFTGEGVVQINTLQIFTRWGERVFKRDNFPPNIEQLGWNGIHNGLKMNPAVFTYYTVLTLTNGTTIELEGDVSIID